MRSPDDLKRPHRRSLLVLLAVLVSGCAGPGAYRDTPRVSLVSIQPKEMGVLEQRYGLQLRILNPNDTALPVTGMQYSLQINDHEFAYGVSRQPVTIPAYGEALLDVDVVSNLLSVLQQLQEANTGTQQSLTYRLSGNLSLENRLGKLPFDYHGELNYLPVDSTAR
ncbi:MAG: LEA type 2 family protein [Gammaproteobacteria bacterium]